MLPIEFLYRINKFVIVLTLFLVLLAVTGFGYLIEVSRQSMAQLRESLNSSP